MEFHLSAVTIDCVDPEGLAVFWAHLLGGDLSVPLPGWQRLTGSDESRPVLTFQPVPEPKCGKARLHLDLVVDDIEKGIQEVVRLGGRSMNEGREYPEGVVVVMADPEGNEFCLVSYVAPRSPE